MRNSVEVLFLILSGVAVGSVVTWRCMNRYYENRVQEEIESVKAAFSKRLRKDEKPEPTAKAENIVNENEAKKGASVIEYVRKLKESGYISEDDANTADPERPYVISPEEFGEFYDYSTNSLTFFADGVLADENYVPVDDIPGTIGEDSLTHFGEYEEDSVHVRNDARKSDYEILLDTRRYEDIIRSMPPQPLEEE